MEDSQYINKQKMMLIMMFNINNSNYILFTRQNWIRVLIHYHQHEPIKNFTKTTHVGL